MRRDGFPRPALVLALLGLAVAGASAVAPRAAHRPGPARPAAGAVTSIPLSFEPAGEDGFLSRGPGYSLALTPSEAVLAVPGGSFRLRPSGALANPGARLVAREPLGATVTHFRGDDPARWRSGVPSFGRVEVHQVWPGVDMVWHGDHRRLQHDMVVAPGVDPAVVAFDVDGAAALTLDPGGDLVVDLAGAEARLARPVLYQDVGGRRRAVDGGFLLLGPSRIGFRVGEYDKARPLVIDPTLVTSTLLGGGGNDSGYGIAVDAQGHTYVTGSTESADFPSAAPLQSSLANAGAGRTSDVFVTKLSPDGSRLVWSTYLGGRGRDTGYGIAVGADGSVYVTGVTESSDFPRARAAQENYGGGPSDAFAAKIAADGTTLEWSTFVGGSQTDRARGLAVDLSGNAFLTGSTNSIDFPAVNPLPQPGPFQPDDVDAFLVRILSRGGPLASATRLGGSNDDRGLAVAVDGQGHAYVTGDTLSPGFPTVSPLQAGSGGSPAGVAGSFPDAFVAKFNPTASGLVYSTFLGGTDVDQGTAIAVDPQGAAYVAGNTNSPNFPTVAPAQARKENDADAFVAKINPAGSALVYSTYAGGSGADGANAIAVDRSGNAYVAGTTGSANWPTNRAVQATRGGGEDAFVLQLGPAGVGAFSTFLGGRDADAGMGIVLDGEGNVRLLGLTSSADFPLVRPLQGARPAAGGDAFVATLDLADAAPSPATPSAAPAATGSDEGHDRRVRVLSILTVALLVAAVGQTLYLRRRPASAGAKGSPSPAPPPPPTPPAAPGLKVLGDKKAAPSKAAGSRSARAPKMRGGPKGGRQKTPAGAGGTSASPALPLAEEDWPTAVEPEPHPKPRQEPAVAQLLEEDMWAPERPAEAP
ncbi:MAG: SBBP repeat-containing protein, partial [Actinomycetota bacterium]|nr:SBBP repeat-containing protein [Actinomycetota bacterium]